jgi:hypothetical protein
MAAILTRFGARLASAKGGGYMDAILDIAKAAIRLGSVFWEERGVD